MTPVLRSSSTQNSGAAQAGRSDVGVDVERPAGMAVGEPHLAQRRHHVRAALGILLAHGLDRVLRPGDRRQRAILRRGVGVDAQRVARLDQLPGELLGRGQVADAPAGHGVGLGEAVERDGALAQPRQRGGRQVLRPRVDELGVDLVGDEDKVVPDDQVADLADDVRRGDRAGRVVGRHEHEHLRARGDARLNGGGHEREVVLFVGGHRHRHARRTCARPCRRW